eukprot:CAMPEP_0196667380 /NCGR_PEP_ID=MMETSP1086-20130531/65048_1 /TAXON_ID=77921 /ORGANISM="Cyanoptyche  gloeocystis , Strain SAG4.97" /LENGTH=332 /DNA_ID=CAMNT_0042004705 /DNA_START=53 /DNA_END=1051 /DNA_ORIENTATION=-
MPSAQKITVNASGDAPCSSSWIRPSNVEGKPPSERWGHSAVLWQKQGSTPKLVIFGGFTSAEGDGSASSLGGRCFSDVHVLDLEKHFWTTPEVSEIVPAARWGHSAVIVEDKLVVFGGYSSTSVQGNTFFNDFNVLDLEAWTWSRPTPTGKAPCERWGNSVTKVGDFLVVVGGYSRSAMGVGRCFKEVYIFDLGTLHWSQPIILGKAPQERTGHSATLVGNRIYVIGGASAGDHCYNDVYSLTIVSKDLLVWSGPLKTSGRKPSERCGQTLGLCGSHLALFGGVGAGETGFRCLNDVHILCLDTMKWHQPTLGGVPPSERWGHSAVSCASTR